MSMPLRWEFPGGKVEPGEKAEAALRREIAEELGIDIEVGEHIGSGEACAGERRIRLEVYLARLRAGSPIPREHAQVRWVAARELAQLRWADADVPIVPQVMSAMER